MDFTKLFDWISLSSGRLLAVSSIILVASGFLVFGPDQLLEALEIDQINVDYRPWPGLALLLSGIATIVSGATSLNPFLNRTIRNWQRPRRLRNLTPEERGVLRGYVERQTRTRMFKLENGIVKGLVHADVIYLASGDGYVLEGFAHNIHDWAWDYLQKHPNLVSEPGKPK